LINKLVCSKEKRLDVYQALSHDFFKEKTNLTLEEINEEEMSAERHISMLANNILNFKT